MKEKIKIGYIGLGRRGEAVLKQNLALMKDVEIRTVCDLSDARMENAKSILLENGKDAPIMTKDYKDILHDDEIDAVFIMSGWSGRPEMAMEFMRAGKYTAIEVRG